MLTLSTNYGTYFDENKFANQNKEYFFENGVYQTSSFIEINFVNILENIDLKISYAKDKGQLLNDSDAFLLLLNYKF